ncbi:MAG TPA: hypothetical protein VEF06_09765 [Bryobacteraceae bacterium]|nr:hypothetical protein [Bryobacteraceae bacterium]
MKTKLIGVLALLAGSTLFAAPRVAIGIGVGVPAYGYMAPAPVYVPPASPAYGYVAPAPVVVPPVAGQVWIDGYWGFVGGARVWHPGYWAPRPVFRGGFRR